MKTVEFEELELIGILDHVSDLRLISDKISAVYSDIYEFILDCNNNVYENENDAKYMIYADIISEYIDSLKNAIDGLEKVLDKREK